MASAENIKQFSERVKNLLANLPGEITRVNNGLALIAVADIRRRIIDTGVDGKGKSLGTYSTTPLPLFFYTNKGTGSGADTALNKLVKKKKKAATKSGEKFTGVSYKEVRELNNKPTAHVTLDFTGETMGDLGVINEVVENNIVRTTVGSRNTKTKAKYNAKGQKVGENTTEQVLNYLGDQYGENILAVTPEEETNIAQAFDEGLQSIVNKYFQQ